MTANDGSFENVGENNWKTAIGGWQNLKQQRLVMVDGTTTRGMLENNCQRQWWLVDGEPDDARKKMLAGMIEDEGCRMSVIVLDDTGLWIIKNWALMGC